MNRIKDAFKNGKALIAFLTCGDPDMETTEKLIMDIENAGADMLQLGIPFSDPTAEGPVIQAASERALANGTTTDKVFDMISRVRDKITVPLVLLTYANVVYSYGVERFCQKASGLEIDGIILHDVPFEEMDEFAPVCKAAGLELISFAAPTSGDRLPIIAKAAEGFVYSVSCLNTAGVTKNDIIAMLNTVRENTEAPIAIGSGIEAPEIAAEFANYADGVIVDEAVMELVGKYGRDASEPVREYIGKIKSAISDRK